ncbi:uncharacterized protein Z518_08564 [Rhinocladiella mackenziei CBS 650.93]|uniref:CAP-Gly domain-containing protein n=1 Tax=Rhinocladiella mackenziei CBS 650.93 TaxID=1442369 RepID=A0A0D2FKZ9_9EURO|nr:uncharacterized protein Z518_08564 [Rhinocladiella mackenziei CBS 650.93]KIX02622.1 hypothetical protein Z518_08564 [Rhinocladiella mackenziei CBS 650.93]
MASVSVGDTVMVPGDMHGVVKFIGPVAGKKGTFAGVQLATEYAPRGKNSGEVDGKFYFKTTIPGSGIFLPLEKAVKKPGPGVGLGVRASPGPGTPTRLNNFNQGGRTPGIAKPSFSQSVGPGMRAGAASPALKPPARRESLPRPSSPLRKANTPTPKVLATPKTRPSGMGLAKSTNGGPGQYRPGQRPAINFSQSLRQNASTPSQSSASPSLGPESGFDELTEQDADATPTPTPHGDRNVDVEKYEVKIRGLNEELNNAKRQLREQGTNFTEMERNFNELQKLLPGLEESQTRKRGGADDDGDLPRDVVSLRDALREKNEKIKILTAEFDANRADFRSTIDTLEMASTETERVYEKRVDELLEEVRNLQDRSEDVESVAQQLKQLEELVQELEEGLEDARRGEAEARAEVEFLRGEVERSRSELRRERERLKTEEQLNGYSPGNIQDLETQLNNKDDEIRGLKAIIQNLNDSHNKVSKTNGNTGSNGHNRSDSATIPHDDDDNRFSMQQQIRDLEALLQQKSAHEEELVNEVKQLRNSVTLSKFPMSGAAFGIHTAMRSGNGSHSRGNSDELDRKHLSTGTTGSQRTVVLGSKGSGHGRNQSQQIQEWHDARSGDASPVKHHEYMPDMNVGPDREREQSDDGVTDVSSSSAALWCEICEEGGHDILTCSNMFGPGKAKGQGQGSLGKRSGKEAVREGLRRSGDHNVTSDLGMDQSGSAMDMGMGSDRPAPLMSRKFSNNIVLGASNPPPTMTLPSPPIHDEPTPSLSKSDPAPAPVHSVSGPIEGTGAQAGMLAGRTSGAIDPEKWCALCERDGHDSVDCPLEDAF